MKKKDALKVLLPIIVIWAFQIIGCSGSGDDDFIITDSGGDGDTDTDTDTDGDTDSDSDTDVDTDSDTDTDTDSDVDSDTDADTDDSDGGSDGDTDTDADADADTDADGDADGGDDAGTDGEVCANLSTAIEAKPVKMMLLQDLSGSMKEKEKWPQAKAAITTLVGAFDSDIQFGLDVFPNSAICDVSEPLILEPALNNGSVITGLLDDLEPTSSTPLYKGIKNFTDPAYAPTFATADMDRYLLIISDGGDTCFEGFEIVLAAGPDAAGPEDLGAITQELNEIHGIKTFVIGFGLNTGANGDIDSLNAIAQAGGMRDEYIDVQNEEELTTALTQIGASVVSCVYGIGEQDPQEVNLDLVNVYFNETDAVPRDDGCVAGKGWSWTNDTRTEIQFCQESCNLLQTGDVVDISIKIMCTEDDLILI